MAQDHSEKTAAELFGPGVPAATTRDRIIETAMDLFMAHGFHAVGVDRIINEVGVTKTTFYNHFESRDQLAVEVIKRRDAWELEAWLRAARERVGRNPRELLLALFDVLDEWFNAPDYKGCLFLNAASEFPDPNDPVHQAAAHHKRGVGEAISRIAGDAGAADPDDLAVKLALLIEGATSRRQTALDHGAAGTARDLAAFVLDDALPARSE